MCVCVAHHFPEKILMSPQFGSTSVTTHLTFQISEQVHPRCVSGAATNEAWKISTRWPGQWEHPQQIANLTVIKKKLPSLKLTANAPENHLPPQKEISSSNYWFSGGKLAVDFRECRWHTNCEVVTESEFLLKGGCKWHQGIAGWWRWKWRCFYQPLYEGTCGTHIFKGKQMFPLEAAFFDFLPSRNLCEM